MKTVQYILFIAFLGCAASNINYRQCFRTRAALAEFQAKAGIPAWGKFGPITRAYLSK